MDKSTATTGAPVPSLTERYNGPPPRLAAEAVVLRDRLASNRTLPAAVPRRRGLQPPPGMTAAAFLAAVDDLRAALGGPADLVQVHDGAVALVDGWYMDTPRGTHDAFHVADPEGLASSAVVFPRSTADVQAVVRWANRHRTAAGPKGDSGIPLYPTSMGKNLGYGGAAPRVPGGVVVDLGRHMHGILALDGATASCLVEPGVSYFALYEAVQAHNAAHPDQALWIDTPDLGGGSVVGNAVDRGVGYTPYGDHFARHCGMELVLPDGSLLRTGLGALPGPPGPDGRPADNPAWQAFPHAFGPAVDGLFSQSSLGIVTRMGFHLMPAPPAHQSYVFTFPHEDDFGPLVDTIRPLAQRGLIGNVPQIRQVAQELACTGRPRWHFRAGANPGSGAAARDDPAAVAADAQAGPLTDAEIQAAAAAQPLGPCAWVFYGTQYGTPAAIAAQLAEITAAFQAAIPGARLVLPDDLPPDHYLRNRVAVCSGTPSLRELDWLNWVPNAAHVFFSPIAPTRGADAVALHGLIRDLHRRHGFDCFPTLCVTGREMHYIANLVYDRADPAAKRRAVRCMRDMIAACAARGFGEYRTHLLFQDQVARTYSWGGQALLRFNQTVKDALDPHGVLAPGRCGIWPKAYRGKGWELGVDDVDLDVIGPKRPKL